MPDDVAIGFDPDSGMWLAVLDWQPWAKKRPKISKAVAGRKARTHQDPDDKQAEQRTHDALDRLRQDYSVFPLASNVRVRVRFYRESLLVVDGDNLFKHLLDAAQGVLFVNDTQVTDFHVTVDLDRDRPRTELAIGTDMRSTMVRRARV